MFAPRWFRSWLVLPLIFILAACGSVETEEADLDASYAPAPSLGEAVDKLLAAEQKRDRTASFALLTPEARTEYKDVADWTTRRNQLPDITGFKLEGSEEAAQTVTVEHVPALDPFRGLSAAKETQVWIGHKFEEGWLLEPDPETNPILPSDEKAVAAVVAWTKAVQSCDQKAAESLQAVTVLLASTAPTLCNVPGDVVAGDPVSLPEGPESANVVEQYSTDAFGWAAAVSVTAPVAFNVILAPLGDEWKVLGLY